MGVYVNPNNRAYQKDISAEIYVDKTELLSIVNRRINTPNAYFCNSRPRRFGKSMTVHMLSAYYGKKCDSKELFSDLKIAKAPDFEKHLNHYDIICIDIQSVKGLAGGAENMLPYLQKKVIEELHEEYPEIAGLEGNSIQEVLIQINQKTGAEFGIILDEWDCIIRDDSHLPEVQKEYIDFLRGLFKGLQASQYIAFAYLTGILPIKKYNTQSALNNFEEFTMLDAAEFAPYIGFTEEEVEQLCMEYHRDFREVKRWYDGYLLENISVYNPKAVISLMQRGNFRSYWSQTGTYESIRPLINMDFDGLKEAIIHMTAGMKEEVEVRSYSNDMENFHDKDDVLTALIHLGYLAYDKDSETVYVPNEEIRQEFILATKKNCWTELNELMYRSEELLFATWEKDCKKVAELIENFHQENTSVIQYHNENSLSSVLSIAYLSALKYYYKPVREFPSGKGFADLIFVPKREQSTVPALLLELKWNQSAETALNQIKEKKYTEGLQGYTGSILLVGINYDKKSKTHECRIEELDR